MMTTDEIRALAKDLFTDGDDLAYRSAIAIETLLARQAEVMRLAQPPSVADLVEIGGWLEVTTNRLDTIRAILNPENDT